MTFACPNTHFPVAFEDCLECTKGVFVSDNKNNPGESDDEITQTQISETAPASEVNDLQSLVDKARSETLYLRAEFDNYKRNAIKERSDLQKFASERVFVELLNILDNFERALAMKVGPENIATYVKGVEMTAQELKALITKFGVTEVISHGQPFNPQIHEALSSEETSEVPEGHVFRVFRKPYKLHDKVIRPGQVVVAKKQTVN